VELLGLEAMDIGISPTRWQRDLFPQAYRSRIRVIHEGVDTSFFSPDETAVFELPETRGLLTRKDKVLTFATSSLEPYRGIHIFLRALPEILKSHPDCQIVIAGSVERTRYGKSPKGGLTRLINELLHTICIPRERIHWVGLLNIERYRALLRVSTAHVYLTVPFVLSWSLIEAMSVGCSIVASATPPVEEVLRDEENALLVEFQAVEDLAAAVSHLLSNPTAYQHLGRRARQIILSRYDREQACRSYNGLLDELQAITHTPFRRKII
jgi:glycosyltransferase involved in cell wall biosynthesis